MHAVILGLHENEKNSKQVSESLALSGHKIISVKNLKSAIELLKNQRIDLVVSDVHLENGGSVFDFLRWTRNNPATKYIPFVLLSTEPTSAAKYVEDGVRMSARVLGASLYIAMEIFDDQEFCREIDSLLPAGDQLIKLTLNGRQLK